MPKPLVRLVSVCALTVALGACSEATRFTEAPFSNPFKTAQAPSGYDPTTTGSIGRSSPQPASSRPYESAPVASAGGVRSQPLPPPSSSVALRSAPVSSPAPAVVGSAAGWSAQGGTPIVMAHGETLDTISGRYGVPRSALMSANGLSSAEVTPGTRIVVPVYNASGSQTASRQPLPNESRNDANRLAPPPAARPVAAIPAARPVAAAPKAMSAAEAKAQAAAEAKAKAAADAKAMSESRARFAAEAKAKAAAKPVAEAKSAASAPAPVAAAKPRAGTQVASLPAEQKPAAQSRPEPKPVAEPQTTASLPPKAEEPAAGPSADFRWPARGRVIAGYNGKGGNEGINIAVPEGTPVKAAEGGVVAYAGSELKGYGNLVLIRHPNGYVSAYAHNGELNVKRGDQVKRGQVVAKSGQSGNVNSPQLHFELRKGSTPVDPVPYLNN
jgi:murein DD-endopeptidase MepM/ murein hydrolase activator NlpD